MDNIRIEVQGENYPAVGRCIYCGSNGGDKGLRKEHIIPYALGGNAVLPKASCAACEKITSYLEGFVGRRVYGIMRSFYEIQKRKRKKAHTVTMFFKTEANEQQPREVSVRDAPPLLLLREFGPAGIIEGKTPGKIVVLPAAWIWYSHEFIERAERLRQPGDLSWSIPFVFKEEIFARFLAKIAHCIVIAQFGIDNFRAFLPPFILGTDHNIGWLVGGGSSPTEVEAPLPKGRHTVTGHKLTMGMLQNDVTKHTILFVDIQIFPFTGSPGYRVVVGEPGPEIIAQLT